MLDRGLKQHRVVVAGHKAALSTALGSLGPVVHRFASAAFRPGHLLGVDKDEAVGAKYAIEPVGIGSQPGHRKRVPVPIKKLVELAERHGRVNRSRRHRTSPDDFELPLHAEPTQRIERAVQRAAGPRLQKIGKPRRQRRAVARRAAGDVEQINIGTDDPADLNWRAIS